MIYQFQRSHLFRRLLYCLPKLWILQSFSLVVMVGSVWVTEAIIHIDGGSGALEDTECFDYWWRHSILWLIDLEVLERSFGLGTPVFVRGDFYFAKGIALNSGGLPCFVSDPLIESSTPIRFVHTMARKTVRLRSYVVGCLVGFRICFEGVWRSRMTCEDDVAERAIVVAHVPQLFRG